MNSQTCSDCGRRLPDDSTSCHCATGLRGTGVVVLVGVVVLAVIVAVALN